MQFSSSLLAGKVVGRSLMWPESLCFLFSLKVGLQVAAKEQNLEQCQGQEAGLSCSGVSSFCPIHSQARVDNVCWHVGSCSQSWPMNSALPCHGFQFVVALTSLHWERFIAVPPCPVPVQSAGSSHRLTNERICPCEHRVQQQVKQWTPSILNSLLTWCSGCGAAPEATSCSLLFLVLFCL